MDKLKYIPLDAFTYLKDRLTENIDREVVRYLNNERWIYSYSWGELSWINTEMKTYGVSQYDPDEKYFNQTRIYVDKAFGKKELSSGHYDEYYGKKYQADSGTEKGTYYYEYWKHGQCSKFLIDENWNKKIIEETPYIDGKKHGTQKKYFKCCQRLKFRGDWSNGKPVGEHRTYVGIQGTDEHHLHKIENFEYGEKVNEEILYEI